MKMNTVTNMVCVRTHACVCGQVYLWMLQFGIILWLCNC
jgi:hypothetical protein